MKDWVIVALLMLSPGCYYATRLQDLQNRLALVEAQANVTSTELQGIKDKTQNEGELLKKKLAETDTTTRSSIARDEAQWDRVNREFAGLRGQLEVAQNKLQELERRGGAVSPSLPAPATPPVPAADAGIPDAGTPAAPRPPEGAVPPPAAPAAAAPVQDTPNTPEEILAKAKAFTRTDVAYSRRLYTEYLRRWPQGERAPEAYLALGESYYDERPRRCREALYEYEKVINGFPQAPEASLAYLHSGDCFAELKLPSDARLFWETLVKDYPKSREATVARRSLARMKAAGRKR